MINVEEKKEKIAEIIKARGPSLPIQIAKEIELSSLFTSAIMSEMISNKMIKTSNLKVGGSPLYLIKGQEPLLEKFSNYLGQKEKEIFLLLKERGVLQDEALEPAHRVAIRSIKDFAIPLKVNLNNEEKIFWRFLTFSMEDSVKKIRDITKPKAKPESILATKEKVIQEARPEEKKREEKKTAEKPAYDFETRVKEYAEGLGIKIIQEIEKKKKDIIGTAILSSSIGNIEVLLIAKDKKLITENDLNLALSRGQGMKLPVLFLSTGKMNKKALSQIETFKSYLIFREISS